MPSLHFPMWAWFNSTGPFYYEKHREHILFSWSKLVDYRINEIVKVLPYSATKFIKMITAVTKQQMSLPIFASVDAVTPRNESSNVMGLPDRYSLVGC